jgi:hypothetical protein
MDAHAEIDIWVALPGSPVRFFTRSPEPGNVPWGVEHASREFVVEVYSSAVSQALSGIERYLLADLREQMVREVFEEEARRVQKQ